MLAATAQSSRPRVNKRAKTDVLSRYMVTLCCCFFFAALWYDLAGQPVVVKLGFYSLSIAEPLIASAASCMLCAFLHRTARVTPLLLVTLTLLVSMMIALARGLMVDPMRAVFEARPLISGAMLPLLGAMLAGRTDLIRLGVKAIKVTGGLLTLLVVSRVLFHYPSNEFVGSDGRALLQYGSLIVAAASLLCVSDSIRMKEPGYQFQLGMIFLVACLCTRQATSSIAALAGMALMLFIERGRALGARRMIVVVIACLVGIILSYGEELLSSVDTSGNIASYMVERSGTNLLRHLVWESFIQKYLVRSTTDMIIGPPLGIHEDIYITHWGGTHWDKALHSMYYETLQYQGALGLICYILTLVIPFCIVISQWLRGQQPRGPVSFGGTAGLIVICAIFGYSYDLHNQASFLLMIVVAATANAQNPMARRRETRRPATMLARLA